MAVGLLGDFQIINKIPHISHLGFSNPCNIKHTMRQTLQVGNRIYVLDSVCMRIYNLEGQWLQMVSLSQAVQHYRDILEKMRENESDTHNLRECFSAFGLNK